MAFIYFDAEKDRIIVAKNRGAYGTDLGEIPYRMKGVEREEYTVEDFSIFLISLERRCIEFLMLVYNPRTISKI